jgi:cyanate permease
MRKVAMDDGRRNRLLAVLFVGVLMGALDIAIVGPALFGWIRDLTQNYSTLFVFANVAFAAALVCMLFVRHGEAVVNPAEAAKEAKAIEAA